MEIWKSLNIQNSCSLIALITLRILMTMQHLTHIQYKASVVSSHTCEVLTENYFTMPRFMPLISDNSSKHMCVKCVKCFNVNFRFTKQHTYVHLLVC